MKHIRGDSEHTLAVFIDFENLALGFHSRSTRFRIDRVLERLVEKGKIVVKRAYCDWSRFGQYTGPLHEAAIELIEIPKRTATGKNSADIRLVVDAIDLAYSKEHIDTFVIVSGDSDFSPLVSKLKELGKHVIGLGLAAATSDLLRDNCDEFIYYEDLDRAPTAPVADDSRIPDNKRKMFNLLMDSLLALRRENKDVIGASMVKDTMKRKKPSFNEGYYGYATFSELLEDAQEYGLLELDKHKTNGTYLVTRFGTEPRSSSPPPQAIPTPQPAKPPVRQSQVPGDADRSGGANRRRRGGTPARTESETSRPLNGTKPAPVPAPPIAVEPPALPDRALGRALIEELDALDDVDVVPTYHPRPIISAKPAESQPPPGQAAAPGKRTPAPARKQGEATKREQPAAGGKPRAATTPKPKKPAPAVSPAPAAGSVPAKPAPAKPVPPPASPPEESDEDAFGAGLDL